MTTKRAASDKTTGKLVQTRVSGASYRWLEQTAKEHETTIAEVLRACIRESQVAPHVAARREIAQDQANMHRVAAAASRAALQRPANPSDALRRLAKELLR